MAEQTFKKVCECKNCGNEAEMVITCSLAPDQADDAEPTIVSESEGTHTAHAVCSHCGGEADIWLNI